MGCRSAASWSTWTAVRWRTHWPDAPPSPETGCLGRQLLVQAEQAPVTLVAARGDFLGHHGAAYGAAGFFHVPAILEAAICTEPVDLDETPLGRPHEACRRRKVA